ncbi:MAG: ParB N-terminal domain-containing protein [Clostridium sp.]|nr:ParB N-terminal domain-containing protein [Clostridium sp.]
MEIIYKNIDELIPYENNPRLNDEAVEYVKNSIKEFGFKVPIVIDKDNVIIAGHTRIKASKELGIKDIPCIIADDLTEEQVKAFRLADNKVAEKSMWDYTKLDEELEDILDIDMSLFDFNIVEDSFDTDFSLADGDREPIQTMSLTFSDEQVEVINEAISKMKQTDVYKNYDGINKNSNGNAMYLVVLEWLQQKI